MAAKTISKTRQAELAAAVASYEENRTDFDRLGQILLMHLVNDEGLKGLIHSGKYRAKDPAHLLDKLQRKEFDKKGKLLPGKRKGRITKANLLTEIDDLAGVRLLHLHTQQMAEIHPALEVILKRKNRYKIVKKPVVYIWDIETKEFFKSIGIKPIERPEMYTSVHYVLESAQWPGARIELQVRTLMEEVWGEVSHTIDYPHPSKVLAVREQLKALARMTSGCSRLVDSIFASDREARAVAEAAAAASKSAGKKATKKRAAKKATAKTGV